MKLIEEYIEFDGSRVSIWQRTRKTGRKYSFLFMFFNKYFWVVYSEGIPEKAMFTGNSMTISSAKKEILNSLLDKEWDNLPPRVKVENGKRIEHS